MPKQPAIVRIVAEQAKLTADESNEKKGTSVFEMIVKIGEKSRITSVFRPMKFVICSPR
jgi:hypothetical protein